MMRLAVVVVCLSLVYGKNTISIFPSSSTVAPSGNVTANAKNHTSTIKTVAPPMTKTPNKTVHTVSSTVKPSNATTHAPTSSVHPTTKPRTKPTTKPPTFGDYDVKKGDKFCLLTEMKVSLDVKYERKKDGANDTKGPTNETTIMMPMKNGTFEVGGKCGGSQSSLKVQWPKTKPLFTMRVVFSMAKSAFGYSASANETWKITMVTVEVNTVNNSKFIHAKDDYLTFEGNANDTSVVKAKVGHTYSCGDLTFKLGDKKSNLSSLKLSISSAKFQPFASQNTTDFAKDVTYCPAVPTPTPASSSSSDIVPIAVGCALAGLVLIVLIAYIIGRRKSQRGYEKV